MKIPYFLKFGFRLIHHEKRTVLVNALSVSVAIAFLLILLTLLHSAEKYFISESRTLLGGDIVIDSDGELEIDLENELNNIFQGNTQIATKVSTYASVLGIDKSSGVNLKAISNNYPLYGQVITKNGNNILKPNSIIVEESLAKRLGVNIGDTISLGQSSFIIIDYLIKEPDEIRSQIGFAPRAIILLDDFDQLGIDENRSRIDFDTYIKTDEDISNTTKEKLKLALEGSGGRVTYADEGPRRLLRSLDSARIFLVAINIFVFALTILNLFTSANAIARKLLKSFALAKTLGMRSIECVYSLQTLVIFSTAVGLFFGIVISLLASYFIENNILSSLDVNIPITVSYIDVFVVIVFGIIFSILSSLPASIILKNSNPNILIRNKESTEISRTSLFVSFLLLTAVFLLFSYVLTNSILSSFYAVFGIFVSISFVYYLVYIVQKFLYKNRFRLSFKLRSVVAFLNAESLFGRTTITALTLALAGLIFISLSFASIKETLQFTIDNKAPTAYFIDIQKDQTDSIKNNLGSGIEMFVNVRGRILSIDDRNIEERLQDPRSGEDRELGREFNLTYREYLLPSEKIVEGVFHSRPKDDNFIPVSTDREFSKRVNIELGSKIVFFIQGITINAEVTSIRESNTSDGLPFFYFVFETTALENFPATYFGYTYEDEKLIDEAENFVAINHPNVTVLRTKSIGETILSVTSTIQSIITLITIPAILLSSILLINLFSILISRRIKDMAILNTLGLKKIDSIIIFGQETLLITLLSTITAYIIGAISANIFIRNALQFKDYYFIEEIMFLGILIFISVSVIISTFIFSRSSSKNLKKII